MAQAPEDTKIAGLPIEKAGERRRFLKMLVYGDPGVGKTLLAATAYDVEVMRPILFVDMEGGIEVFQDRYPQIETIRIKDTINSQGKLIRTAWQNFSNVYEELKKGTYTYNTIIIDSLTEAYELAKKHWLYQVTQDKPDRDPDMPAERDWVKQKAIVRRMVKFFRDLDKHVIFTALKTESKDADTGRIINYVPSLSGKLNYEVAAMVSELFYMDVVLPSKKEIEEGGDKAKGKRRLLTQPVNKYLAKDRSDNMPLQLEHPTIQKIVDLVLAKEGN